MMEEALIDFLRKFCTKSAVFPNAVGRAGDGISRIRVNSACRSIPMQV